MLDLDKIKSLQHIPRHSSHGKWGHSGCWPGVEDSLRTSFDRLCDHPPLFPHWDLSQENSQLFQHGAIAESQAVRINRCLQATESSASISFKHQRRAAQVEACGRAHGAWSQDIRAMGITPLLQNSVSMRRSRLFMNIFK